MVPRSAGARDGDPALAERGDLGVGGVVRAPDDRAGVAHPLARRGGASGDEGGDGLGHVVLDPVGGLDLVGAADLADHDDAVRLRVGLEPLEQVDEAAAADGSPPMPMRSTVRSRGPTSARPPRRSGCPTADDPRRPCRSRRPRGRCGCARHDADLAATLEDRIGTLAETRRPGVMMPGQFGPIRTVPDVRGTALAVPCLDRDALGDRADDVDAGGGGLEDRIGRERRGTKIMVASAPVSATASWTVSRIGMPIGGPALAGRDATDHAGAVRVAASGVERPEEPVMPAEDLGAVVDENGHSPGS